MRSFVLGFAWCMAAGGALGGAAPGTATEAKPQLSSSSPPGAEVYFIEPVDGATVKPTFVVKFGLRGMGVAPAGVDFEHTGHHHLLIDQEKSPDMALPLPATDRIIHFGKGQTEAEISLPPGEHRLQLMLGNHLHVPHTPPVASKVIRITVAP